jgi:DNA topoisomerase I
MHVVVVESPAKAKTINKYLGPNYDVVASFGHVRDLPSKDGSVKPDDDFAMVWEADTKGAARIRDIADRVKKADGLILATDPDREGEAISWHLLEALKARKVLKDKDISRVTFNAITKDAVLKAMAAPRQIDQELVDAYLARRALDYLVGFNLSPVLWRKLPGARSAGRVQSVALRLVVQREMEIEKFIAREYWTVAAQGKAQVGAAFEARLFTLDGKKLDKFDLPNEALARGAEAAVLAGKYSVGAVEAKPLKRSPAPPFTTSTLQQEASRKLGFNAQRTMQVAQKLYEGVDIGGETVGLITYMRTDGVAMDQSAIMQCRAVIGERFGSEYVPEKPRYYSSKAKNAQEAHEAIRPTDPKRHPSKLRLEGDMARLYDLVWKRAIASQMEQAIVERTTIDLIDAGGRAGLRATGQVILFDGFFALYQEGRDDEEDEDARRLPALKVGDAVTATDVKATQHFTEPPPRYSEATLVKKMEELGIGRPSTYASVLTVLRDREYVVMDKNRFIPEDKGRLVTAFLENFFAKYVEYDFTAALEERLDLVSSGDLEWKILLRDFWVDFHKAVADTAELRTTNVLDAINESLGHHIFPDKGDGKDPRACPTCADGRLSLKTSKFGAFIGCTNYPECKFTKQLGSAANGSEASGDRALGPDPETGLEVALKVGRFGPYVQLGEGDKPKRSSLPKGWQAADIDLEAALKLLTLPRTVGIHPEDGEPILANLGRFGPYVQHGKTYANVPTIEDVFEIGINRAVTVIAEKRAGGGRPQRGAATPPLKEFLPTEEGGVTIRVMAGRFGPYVTDGTTNATITKGIDPANVTLEIATDLIAARVAIVGVGKKKPARKTAAAAKKPAAKKAPVKKTPVKKATTTAAKKPAAKKPAAKKPAAKPALKKAAPE